MSFRSRDILLRGLAVFGLGSLVAPAASEAELTLQYEKEILPIMVNYCYDCHGDGSKEGELKLDSYTNIKEMISDRAQWKTIRDHIDFRLMPPPDEFAPNEDDRAKLVKWIDSAVFYVDPKNPDPGEIFLRRMNRTEYENTIRDLLNVEINTAEILPPDDSGYGFDNIGDLLTVSPAHMERYLDAARISLEKALDFSSRYPEQQIKGSELNGGDEKSHSSLTFTTNGEASINRGDIKAGKFIVTVRARADEAGDEAAKMELKIDGKSVRIWDVSAATGSDYSAEIVIEQRKKVKVSVGFLNDFYDESQPSDKRDRNLYVEKITITGSVDSSPLPKPKTHLALVPPREKNEADEAYLDRVMAAFLPRAFRRPVVVEEVRRYRHFLPVKGEDMDSAILQALTAALVSPSFLFRDEPVAPGSTEKGGGKILINEHALASRLSYFLWSSMPDARLRELAEAGKLRENMKSEISRMIDSPKSQALVENFVGQWLQLRDMSRIVPRRGNYDAIDRRLPGDMRTETEMLLKHIIHENLPIHTILSADFTFLNERLARHYGMQGVKGENFRKVSIAHTPRRGLLGHASFLTLTSHQTKTSPVLRGKYVLENILDTPPPPAPPNIPALENSKDHGRSQTMRQELERHREDPACSSCHALMDPIGFGLENYDIVGRWRDQDNGKPIDAADTLVTGQKFTSAEEMRDIFINEYKEEFHRAFSVKMLTYALGRGVKYYDRLAIDDIVVKGAAEDGRFLSWVTAITESVPFQYRRD